MTKTLWALPAMVLLLSGLPAYSQEASTPMPQVDDQEYAKEVCMAWASEDGIASSELELFLQECIADVLEDEKSEGASEPAAAP